MGIFSQRVYLLYFCNKGRVNVSLSQMPMKLCCPSFAGNCSSCKLLLVLLLLVVCLVVWICVCILIYNRDNVSAKLTCELCLFVYYVVVVFVVDDVG